MAYVEQRGPIKLDPEADAQAARELFGSNLSDLILPSDIQEGESPILNMGKLDILKILAGLGGFMNLLDPSSMIGGPAGLVFKAPVTAAAKAAWATKPAQQYMKSAKALGRIAERNPANKKLLGKTTVEFTEPMKGVGARTHVLEDTIQVSPPREASKEVLKQRAKTIGRHELDHFIENDPEIYKEASKIMRDAPQELKDFIGSSILSPEKVLLAVDKLGYDRAMDLLGKQTLGELVAYGREALSMGPKTKYSSDIAKNLVAMAKAKPEVNKALQEIGKLDMKASDRLIKVLEKTRKEGKPFLTSSDIMGQKFTADDIIGSIKDEQRKVISTSSKGVTKSKTAASRAVELPPKPTREYIPGRATAYVSPTMREADKPIQQTATQIAEDAWADKMLSGVKDPNLREAAKKVLTRRGLGTQEFIEGTKSAQLPKTTEEAIAAGKSMSKEQAGALWDEYKSTSNTIKQQIKSKTGNRQDLIGKATENQLRREAVESHLGARGTKGLTTEQIESALKKDLGTQEFREATPKSAKVVKTKELLPSTPEDTMKVIGDLKTKHSWLDWRYDKGMAPKTVQDSPFLEEINTPTARKRFYNNITRLIDDPYMDPKQAKLARKELARIKDFEDPLTERLLEFAAEEAHQGIRNSLKNLSARGIEKYGSKFEKAYRSYIDSLGVEDEYIQKVLK